MASRRECVCNRSATRSRLSPPNAHFVEPLAAVAREGDTRAVVAISDRVWNYWREARERDDTEMIELLFASGLSGDEAYDALQNAVGTVMEEYLSQPEPPPGVDELSVGACALALVPDGVVLRVDEYPHDLEELLGRIVERLEAAGVAGTLDLYQPTAVQPPEVVDLLECRIRLRGERVHYRGINHGWRCDPGALAAGIEAGLDWVVTNDPGLPLSLMVGLTSPATLSPREDLRRYLRRALEATAEVGVVHLSSVGSDRFRTLAVDPSKGRVSLIEGGRAVASDWAASLDGVVGMLVASAPWSVYGFVKRGSRSGSAVLANSLADDWVPIPHRLALWAGGEPFENELAPDAFGAQLLGSGYAAAPAGREWRQSAVADGALLVEHVEREAWYGRLFGPFGGYATMPTDLALIPDLVARAREAFHALLFTDDVAREHLRCDHSATA